MVWPHKKTIITPHNNFMVSSKVFTYLAHIINFGVKLAYFIKFD